jgi:tetratricopeptide (TPR) repeat protein
MPDLQPVFMENREYQYLIIAYCQEAIMVQESRGTAEWEFMRGVESLAADDVVAALAHFEKALKLKDNRNWYSYLGYCVARERGQINKGVDFCHLSMEHDPGNSAHYLNLGKIHLLNGNKPAALKVFRDGLAIGENDEIHHVLHLIGQRKLPVLSFLSRSNPLNRYLGLILDRLGLRSTSRR